MAGRLLVAAVAAVLMAVFAAAPVAAQESPWWRGDRDRILGYGCSAIELEPIDPRFDCPPGAAYVHEAIDFDLAYGTRIYAGRPGVVTAVGDPGPDRHDYGPNYVRIWLDEGPDVVLGHLSRAVVKVGDRVSVGTLVGYSGDLGETDLPNLDFSARPHGMRSKDSIDPTRYLTFVPGTGGRDGIRYETGWNSGSGQAWIRSLPTRPAWNRLPGGPADGFGPNLLVAYDGAGHAVVYGAGVDGSLWQNVEGDGPAPSGTWVGWRPVDLPLGLEVGRPLQVEGDPNGSLRLTVLALDGSGWQARRTAGGSWSGWTPATAESHSRRTLRIDAGSGRGWS